MSAPLVERNRTQPIDIETVRRIYPEADQLVGALLEHEGEAIAEVSHHSHSTVSLGRIEQKEEAVTFSRELHKNIDKDNGLNGYLNVAVKTEESEGEKSIYLGTYHEGSRFNLPELFTSTSIEDAKAVDVKERTLIIGDRACGAFGIGRALVESDKGFRESKLYLAGGLVLASKLERGDFDWRPNDGQGAESFNEAIDYLRKDFIDKTFMPMLLHELRIDGSFVSSEQVAERAAIFGFNHAELTDELSANILSGEYHNTDVMDDPLEHMKKQADRFGNFEAYIHGFVANVLTNQLGIAPTER